MKVDGMKLIQWLVGSVLAWYALSGAFYYGGIWESQANPTQGVRVQFSPGSDAEGALSRALTGEWILVVADGSELRFSEFRMMTYPPRQEQRTAIAAVAAQWRTLVPVFAVIGLYLLWLYLVFGVSARTQRGVANG